MILIERLPSIVQANPAYWIERVEKKAGHTVLSYLERVLKDVTRRMKTRASPPEGVPPDT